MSIESVDLSQAAGQFAGYTELRLQENRNLRLMLLNGDLVTNSRSSKLGASARCWNRGRWGFASSADLSQDTLGSLVRNAGNNAEFLASRDKTGGQPLIETAFRFRRDLSTSKDRLSTQQLIEYLRTLDEHIVARFPKVSARQVMLMQEEFEKRLLTSSGSDAFTLLPRAMIYVTLTAENADGEPVEVMEMFTEGGASFEERFDDPETLFPRLDAAYEHLCRKLEAVPARAGRKTVILDSHLTGILAHEAVGHTTEADLVLGGSVAGDNLGRKVASERITMVDFAHSYDGRQLPVPVWIDDEGTRASDAVLIENGILTGFMHSRDTAAHFGHELTGNARAFLYSDEPLIRMRNTAILPGQDRLEDMIASVEDGYYLIETGNGQADSTSEFMFGVTLGYEIKNGKLGRAITDTTISGVAFDMLNSVTMVSDQMSWECGGYCGKKQPMVVSTGGPALKCEVNIGGE